MRGSEFAELRAFATVAKHRSFAKAAAELGISRSALSQTLRVLERRIGVRLLNRTTRSVAPSEAGARLLERLGPLIAELDAIVGDVVARASRVAGTLRINAPRMAVVHYLAPLIGPFLAAYPDVLLDIVADDRLVDMVGDGFDAGIRLGETLERDMIAVPIGGDLRMLVVASPAYIARCGRPATPRDLHRHRCINLRRPTDRSTYRWEFERDGERFDVAVTGPMLVDEPSLARRAMLDGSGIAYLFEHDVADAVEDGLAIELLKDWSPPFKGLHLYFPSRQMGAPLRAFLDFLSASGAVGSANTRASA